MIKSYRLQAGKLKLRDSHININNNNNINKYMTVFLLV